MQKYLFTIITLVFFSIFPAQSNEWLIRECIKSDSLFWVAYNKCNIDEMMNYIPKDVEFYHDKGGIFKGSEDLRSSFEKNLCGNKDFRLRREAINSTVKYFPMKDKNTVYGLIITGEHYFYINETGKKEFRDGVARFTDFWMLENNKWKMSRILSYDHSPAPYLNKREEILLSPNILSRYKGKYNSAKNGIIKVQPQKTTLKLLIGNNIFILYPETSNLFFVKDRDLLFEFVKKNDKVTIMNVYENGNLIEENKVIE